ncbi:mycofactocin-coupled SDR family oxidoreductase [Nocardioides sp.]|uniref:mycofactocin-coupled SDR family oxidoreductase n=1 Tax=Nocardioides sp. TaxID=35761 RepID=UPI002732F64D|nr:mycofactocin-coupled SDR family oxidoreductase [Nocardioides sp.]MDP3892427.1 mycofactocin-coupled SDR family oxidoreductase [Nocardioides sp.]
MADQRVALVTGAARGIGAETAVLLADRGLRVVALDSCAGDDRTRSGVDYPLATRADLRMTRERLGDRGVAIEADVRDAAALRTAVSEAQDRWGRLDVTVAAAAVVAGGRPLWREAGLDTLLQVDVVGVWNTAAASVPAMLEGPDPSGCRFVAVASAAGSRGLFHLAAYTTAKHAVVGLVRGLAADLVGTGVTAVAVSPGATGTAMLDATAALYGVRPADLADSQLLREPLDPREVAATIAFACSPEGRVLNGSVVAADGGFAG